MTIKHFDKKIRLQPVKVGKYHEQVMIIIDDYPIALVHIDTFYDSGNPTLWELLSGKNYQNGKEVTCNMTLEFEVIEDE